MIKTFAASLISASALATDCSFF
jgi:hypothetical protein